MERNYLDKADLIENYLQKNKLILYEQIVNNLITYHSILIDSFAHVASMEVSEKMIPEIVDYYKKVLIERDNPVYRKWYGFKLDISFIERPLIIKRKNNDFSFDEKGFDIAFKASYKFWNQFKLMKNSNYKELISNEYKKYNNHSNPEFINYILNLVVKDIFHEIKKFKSNGFIIQLTSNLTYDIIYFNSDSKRKLKFGFVDDFEVEVYLIKKNKNGLKKEKYFVCELNHPFEYYQSIGYFEGAWRFHNSTLKSVMPFQIFYCYYLKFFFAKQFLDFITEGILHVHGEN